MPMPVAQAIQDLRSQLLQAQVEGQDAKLRFEITDVELELQLVLSSEAGVGGKVGWGILSFGADGKASDENTHKLTLKMKLMGEGPGPIPIAGERGDRPAFPGTGKSPG